MPQYQFTAFQNADLFGHHHIAPYAQFTLPQTATLQIEVQDDDAFLSGDARRNEEGDDQSQQTARVIQAGTGHEIGITDTLYAERVWQVQGTDGQSYSLVELERPGHLPDMFTFLGEVPPPAQVLTVGFAQNVRGDGLAYDQLAAGALTLPLPNIVDIAASSDSFDILVQALSAADLVETVQNATDITVFAPTDAAFVQLAADLGYEGDPTDEEAAFGFIAGALSALSGDGDPIPLLTDILTYHVSPGAKTLEDLTEAGTVMTLLEGATFASADTELVDQEPDIANPTIVVADIAAENGTIQAIDRVLLPIDLPGNDTPAPTLAGLVAQSGGEFDGNSGDFDILLNAVVAADLAGALDDPEAALTVFAPNDAAFVSLAQSLGFDGADEGAAFDYLVQALTMLNDGDPLALLKDVLLYHVAPGLLDDAAVLSATEIDTLLPEATLGVAGATLVDGALEAADPSLIQTNLQASNGIVHVIDGVLLPTDLMPSDDVHVMVADDSDNLIKTGRGNDYAHGNGGDDVLKLGRGHDVGYGGEGDDHLKGGNGRDSLHGNEGDDVLKGGRGHDVLNGGAGDDVLNGGQGDDIFVFAKGDGHDVINRFQKGHDQIDLSDLGITHFDDLAGLMHAGRDGTMLLLDEDQSVFVAGRKLDLAAEDFLFATEPADDPLAV